MKKFNFVNGVIGIGPDGNVIIKSLDKTIYLHSQVAHKIARKLQNSKKKISSNLLDDYESVIIIYKRCNYFLIFFPDSLSNVQNEKLKEIMPQNKIYKYSYLSHDKARDDILIEELFDYSDSIKEDIINKCPCKKK